MAKSTAYYAALYALCECTIIFCNATSVTRFAIFWTLDNFLKPLATINLPKSPTFLGKFCKGVKISFF